MCIFKCGGDLIVVNFLQFLKLMHAWTTYDSYDFIIKDFLAR